MERRVKAALSSEAPEVWAAKAQVNINMITADDMRMRRVLAVLVFMDTPLRINIEEL